ncbi:MAG: M28 family peptidase [Gammaproteobacteria bacterium]|jgi:Zn-dependent M28 family amino/carboxypeptidase|nr:M28 family peptidase [Gammaproteobacteria bacterium]
MIRLLPFLLLTLLLAACGGQPPSESTDEPVGEQSQSADGATGSAVETAQDDEAGQQDTGLPEVPGDGVDAERFAAHVQTLASDEFQGRAPGTRGGRMTIDYLVREFSEMGLEPGYGDSYLQPVPMIELTNAERSDISVDLGGERMTLSYPEQMVINSRRLGADPHAVEGSEIVFVGYGIVAPEYDWNDYEGLDVSGKTVVMLVNDPGFATGEEALFNGRAMTYYGRWTYKYEEAARQGAAAALVVHETEPASYPWEVVINSWSGAEFVLASDESAPRVALEGWLTVDAARELFSRAGLDYEAQKERAKQPGFEWVSLDSTATAQVRNDIRRGTSYNVLAEIPGTERPDEAVVYMAHWDHLGRNLARPGSEGIYNGAVDNASGTAGLLELARLNAQAGPAERSQLFAAVTLEEYGLLGSMHYANDPVYPPGQTAAAINMDAMTVLGPTHDVTVIGYGSSELEDILAEAAQRQGRHIEQEPSPEAGYYYRSDHFNLAKIGIPALYAKGGVDHREKGRAYGLEWQAQYRDERYHKTADTYSEDWDLRGVSEDLELLYTVGREVSGSDRWPEWYEGNEFKAIRESSRR